MKKNPGRKERRREKHAAKVLQSKIKMKKEEARQRRPWILQKRRERKHAEE